MTHPEIFYLYDDKTRIVYWTDQEPDPENIRYPELILLGQSPNPNKRMAMAVFTHKLDDPTNWRLRPLD